MEQIKNFWAKCNKWLVGIAGVVGILTGIFTAIWDVKERVVPANNFNQPAERREMTNDELAKFLKEEIIEMRMEMRQLIILDRNKDTLIIDVKPQPASNK